MDNRDITGESDSDFDGLPSILRMKVFVAQNWDDRGIGIITKDDIEGT